MLDFGFSMLFKDKVIISKSLNINKTVTNAICPRYILDVTSLFKNTSRLHWQISLSKISVRKMTKTNPSICSHLRRLKQKPFELLTQGTLDA